MIFRVFIALLFLNVVGNVATAEASDSDVLRMPGMAGKESVEALQVRENLGDDALTERDMITDTGARLLSLRLSSSDSSGRHYASDSVRPDHSLSLLNEGACLNLRWNF